MTTQQDRRRIADKWLPRPPTPAATGRVFCLPHAGYGAGVFAAWPPQLGGVEFLPVELPGRLPRFGEPVPDSFEELAAQLIAGLTPWFDVPFAFFGHCWSALLAYEVTAQLQSASGPTATRLYVSSQLAPQDGPVGRMLAMTDDELTEELETTIRAQGNEPQRELVALYRTMLRADIEASRHYVVPHPLRLRCPITAIGWRADTEVPPGLMSGWPTCGDTTFTVFDGVHERFTQAPAELLETLRAGL
ncbi:thioesterase II family protein [Nocardia sp. NPDC088792]|uniref:thioesterase II family protein n=1 Tax=Nocardia sp. NPDC088792 TaxID=3364332 RepID=UPI0037FEA27D